MQDKRRYGLLYQRLDRACRILRVFVFVRVIIVPLRDGPRAPFYTSAATFCTFNPTEAGRHASCSEPSLALSHLPTALSPANPLHRNQVLGKGSKEHSNVTISFQKLLSNAYIIAHSIRHPHPTETRILGSHRTNDKISVRSAVRFAKSATFWQG